VNLKNTIKSHFYQKWKTMWKNHTKCKQTKLWFAEPDRTLSRDILQRSKANLGQLVQFFTGHNNPMKHQFNINNDVDSTCRLLQEDEETSWHVIAECPALIQKRWEIFHQPIIYNHPNWSIKQVTRFLRESSIGDLLDQMGYSTNPRNYFYSNKCAHLTGLRG
jgi:hypothetical protein